MDKDRKEKKEKKNTVWNRKEYPFTADAGKDEKDWKELYRRISGDLFLEDAAFCEEVLDSGIREYERRGLLVTEARITNEEQSRLLGRKCGCYVTLYSDQLKLDDGGIHREAVQELAFWIRQLLPEDTRKILVVGLGNAEASPDALGPDAASQVQISLEACIGGNREQADDAKKRKTTEERQPAKSNAGSGSQKTAVQVMTLSPGVMAQTGMETAEILKGVTSQVKPDAVILLDALAAKSVTRVGTTIQLTDAGIAPGAGIGNHRAEISQETLGIPVIAIGVPMVVEAAAIIYETLDAIRQVLKKNQDSQGEEAGFLSWMSYKEQLQLFRELLEEKASPLYVTLKDVDEIEKRLSYTLSEAVNAALL